MAQVLLEVELDFDENDDGYWRPFEGFPFVRRMDVDALHPFFCVTKEGEALSPFKTVGNNEIDVVQLAVLVSDGACTWRLDGQLDGGVDMLASVQNVLILCDTVIDAGAISNIGAPGNGNIRKLYGLIAGQPAVEGECLGYGEGGYGEGGYGCGADE